MAPGVSASDYAVMSSLWSGKPCHIVASSREQAERTFGFATSLLNGRDPKGAVPG